jgi:son of sevenless-like protein
MNYVYGWIENRVLFDYGTFISHILPHSCLHVFKAWIENYLQPEEDMAVLSKLKIFASQTMAFESPTIASQLLRVIERFELNGPKTRRIALTPTSLPSPLIPKNYNFKKIKIFDFDALEVARQISLMEADMYANILHVELLKKAWSDKERSQSPNVKLMIRRANQVTGWATTTILREPDVKKRAVVLKYIIAVAEVLPLSNIN